VVWREAWGCAILVDATSGWLGAAPVKMAPMATFPWVGNINLEGGGQNPTASEENGALSELA
jgi:hypothetical protein